METYEFINLTFKMSKNKRIKVPETIVIGLTSAGKSSLIGRIIEVPNFIKSGINRVI